MAGSQPRVGLILRAEPYRQRSARAQLDVALVAAALDCRLNIYCLGAAVLQLLLERDPAAARLPAGYRGWASLPELTAVTAYAEPGWTRWMRARGALALDLTAMTPERMRTHSRSCSRLVVL